MEYTISYLKKLDDDFKHHNIGLYEYFKGLFDFTSLGPTYGEAYDYFQKTFKYEMKAFDEADRGDKWCELSDEDYIELAIDIYERKFQMTKVKEMVEEIIKPKLPKYKRYEAAVTSERPSLLLMLA